MNMLDILICGIVAFCLIRGLFRGIIKEITSLIGVFVGFYAAYTYYPLVGEWFSSIISNKAYLNIISFIVTFCLLFFAVGFVGVVLKYLLKTATLGGADRILGSIFGFVKAVFIVSVLLVPLTTFLPKNSSFVKDSFLAPRVITVSEKIVAVVPEEMEQKFDNNINSLKKAWKKL